MEAKRCRFRAGQRAGCLLLGIAGLACAGWWANRNRTVPLEQFSNPVYWWRRMRGEDLYDPATRFLYHGDRTRREIALTIDDGPNPEVGGRMLDTLLEKGVRATFFVVGKLAKKHPEMIRRMAREGHVIGSHSQSHLRLDEMREDQIRRDLRDCEINLIRAGAPKPVLLRPPGVRYNKTVTRVANAFGYTLAGWTCTAADEAPGRSAREIVERLERRTENGSILMMHQNEPTSAEALPELIVRLRERGFRFVTIPEMLSRLGHPSAIPGNEAAGNFRGELPRTR